MCACPLPLPQVEAFGRHEMLRELANLVLIMARPLAAAVLRSAFGCCRHLSCCDQAASMRATRLPAGGQHVIFVGSGKLPHMPPTSSCPQGNRDNIDSMASGSQKVLTQVLMRIDAHDVVRQGGRVGAVGAGGRAGGRGGATQSSACRGRASQSGRVTSGGMQLLCMCSRKPSQAASAPAWCHHPSRLIPRPPPHPHPRALVAVRLRGLPQAPLPEGHQRHLPLCICACVHAYVRQQAAWHHPDWP